MAPELHISPNMKCQGLLILVFGLLIGRISASAVNRLGGCADVLNVRVINKMSLFLPVAGSDQIFSPIRTSPLRDLKTPAFGGTVQLGPNLYRVSIDGLRFQVLSSPETFGTQQMSNWCWAACIKMVLNYYNIPIEQWQIVNFSFGRLSDKPGGAPEILGTLNNWFYTATGTPIRIHSKLIDPRSSVEWIDLIMKRQPVIVGLSGSSTEAPGHAYVVKAVDYSLFQGSILVQNVILADPWPASPSELSLSWMEFSQRQNGVYLIY